MKFEIYDIIKVISKPDEIGTILEIIESPRLVYLVELINSKAETIEIDFYQPEELMLVSNYKD